MTSQTWIIDRSPGIEDLDSDGRIQIPVEPADPYSKGTSVSVSCWREGLPWRKTHKGVAKQKQASIGKSCSTCRYWQKRATPGTDDADWCGEWEARSRYWQKWAKPGGECRRNAPQSVMIHAEIDAYWPSTDDADWCGEWEARK